MKKDIQKRGSRPELPTPSGSRSDTPESEAAWERYINSGLEEDIMLTAEKLERERDELREWIMQAAPMLLAAACIVVDEAVERLDEIAGVRGVLELCPVDFVAPEAKPRYGSADGPLEEQLRQENRDLRRALTLAARWGISSDGFSATVADELRRWVINDMQDPFPELPGYLFDQTPFTKPTTIE